MAERPADVRGRAQTVERARRWLVVEQVGETGKAFADRRQRSKRSPDERSEIRGI